MNLFLCSLCVFAADAPRMDCGFAAPGRCGQPAPFGQDDSSRSQLDSQGSARLASVHGSPLTGRAPELPLGGRFDSGCTYEPRNLGRKCRITLPRDNPLPVRLLKSAGAGPFPLIIQLHGGALCWGPSERYCNESGIDKTLDHQR